MSRRNKPARKPNHTLIAQQTTLYKGLLPPPEMMQHYQEIQYDLPERIMGMAEREAAHRHRSESITTTHSIRAAYLGMALAFLSVLVIAGVVSYAIYCKLEWAAATIATGVIVALASVFVYRKTRK